MYKQTIPLYMNRVKERISELSSINKVRRFKTVEFKVPDSAGLVVASLPVVRLLCCGWSSAAPVLSVFQPFLSLSLSSSPGCKKPAFKTPHLKMLHRAGFLPNSGILLVCKARDVMQNKRLVLQASHHNGNKSFNL